MKSLYRTIYFVAAAISLIAIAPPAAVAEPGADQQFVNPNDVKWGAAPPSLPKGAKVAVLYGDPGKAGPFVIRLMAPGGYKIPPHWHSQAENITVISGTLFLGSGDSMDTAHANALRPGGYHYLPAKAHHYAFGKTATIVQVHGDGPFDITYINPADDPQKKPAK